MAEDVKAEEMIDQLRATFTQQIREAVTELPAHRALQVSDALCLSLLEDLAGQRVRFRARPAVDSAAIAASWRRGLSVAEIVQRHQVSRKTAYKYHPLKIGRDA